MSVYFLYPKKARLVLTFAMTWARQIENVKLLCMLDLEDALFFVDLLYTLEVYLFLEYI